MRMTTEQIAEKIATRIAELDKEVFDSSEKSGTMEDWELENICNEMDEKVAVIVELKLLLEDIARDYF